MPSCEDEGQFGTPTLERRWRRCSLSLKPLLAMQLSFTCASALSSNLADMAATHILILLKRPMHHVHLHIGMGIADATRHGAHVLPINQHSHTQRFKDFVDEFGNPMSCSLLVLQSFTSNSINTLPSRIR